jgi:hypothetical protein
MNAKLAVLAAAQAAACAGQEAPLPPCRAAIAAVQQQNAAIQQLQQTISALNAQASAYKTQGDGYRDQAMATLNTVTAQPGSVNTISMIPSKGTPWPDPDMKTCCNPINCITRWALQYRWFSSNGINYMGPLPTAWTDIISGFFSPDGTPFITSAAMCPLLGHWTCWSTNCEVGMTLRICQGTSVVQVQFVTYPPIT